jgi:hypothetical protein
MSGNPVAVTNVLSSDSRLDAVRADQGRPAVGSPSCVNHAHASCVLIYVFDTCRGQQLDPAIRSGTLQ